MLSPARDCQTSHVGSPTACDPANARRPSRSGVPCRGSGPAGWAPRLGKNHSVELEANHGRWPSAPWLSGRRNDRDPYGPVALINLTLEEVSVDLPCPTAGVNAHPRSVRPGPAPSADKGGAASRPSVHFGCCARFIVGLILGLGHAWGRGPDGFTAVSTDWARPAVDSGRRWCPGSLDRPPVGCTTRSAPIRCGSTPTWTAPSGHYQTVHRP